MQGVIEAQARGTMKNIVASVEDLTGGKKHLTHLCHVELYRPDPDGLVAMCRESLRRRREAT